MVSILVNGKQVTRKKVTGKNSQIWVEKQVMEKKSQTGVGKKSQVWVGKKVTGNKVTICGREIFIHSNCHVNMGRGPMGVSFLPGRCSAPPPLLMIT